MIWDKPMVILVTMNSRATSDPPRREDRLKFLRTSGEFYCQPRNEVNLLRQGSCYTAVRLMNPNWSVEPNLMNRVSHPVTCDPAPFKVVRFPDDNHHSPIPTLERWLMPNPKPSWAYLQMDCPPFGPLQYKPGWPSYQWLKHYVGLLTDWPGI